MRMKLFLMLLMVCTLTACSNKEPAISQPENDPPIQVESSDSHMEENTTISSQDENMTELKMSDMEENVMKITVGDTTFTATLADNSSAAALREMLMEEPLTINMSDYGNMEKVGPIGKSLPENNKQITTEAGDIILYQGNSLVIYYDTNTWNFTRLGKINDVTQAELKEALGDGDVIVTFSID